MKAFCESCHDIIDYEVRDVELSKEIKGQNISYKGKKAFCSGCTEEVFVEEILDYNLQQLDDAYRKDQNLISTEEVKTILEKYDIGKRPLSQLLGWGEITITRYADGALPTKQYSDRLLGILDSPEEMDRTLKENKDNITDLAYSKSKAAIKKLGDCHHVFENNDNKIDEVTQYLIANLSDVTPLALQKLLYYSQGFFTVFHEEYLFEDDCEAWLHGPVYKEIYHKYKDCGYNPIDNRIIKDTKKLDLTDKEKEILDAIIKNFGCYSGKVLEKMTHAELPWIEVRKGIPGNVGSTKLIPKALISNYFTHIKDKFDMINTVDIRDYSKDLFNKTF